jgi:hypothetical protein
MIEGLVGFVIYLVVLALVIGLLYWLLTFAESNIPGAPRIVFAIGRVLLVVIAVIIIIYLLLGLVRGPAVPARVV